MKSYDREQPLIFIHVPKAAGTTVRRIFRGWYGDGLLENYFDEINGVMPEKRNLEALHSVAQPVVVYGHFNRHRGFGIDHYYPHVKQFISIMRDPFDTAISTYFFIKKEGSSWLDQSKFPKGDLRRYVIDTPPNILNHFPVEITKDNYRDVIDEFFVDIGITEMLEESLRRIATHLNKPFDQNWMTRENVTERDQDTPHDLQDEYRERHALEFDVYDYVRDQFRKNALPMEN